MLGTRTFFALLAHLSQSQKITDVEVRWDQALNQKHQAFFTFNRQDVHLTVGDNLRLRYAGSLHAAWDGVGVVRKVRWNGEI